MSKKEIPLSPKALEILESLKENGSATLAELKERGIDKVNSSHLTALKNRGLVESKQVEKEVVSVSKRKVLEYSVAETETETAEETE